MNTENRNAPMLSLLAELVRCPTENHPPRGNEAPGQAVLRAAYEAMGLETRAICPADLPEYPDHPAFLPRDFAGGKTSSASGMAPGGGRSVLLTGHMDVVPKEPMPWTVTQPFEPLIRDGRMYGRGTADMKVRPGLRRRGRAPPQRRGLPPPRRRDSGKGVVDEEYAGANGTVAGRLAGVNADFGIVLETTGLNVCPACVGGLVITLRVQGVAGMPYTGRGDRQSRRGHCRTDLAGAAVQRKAHGRSPQTQIVGWHRAGRAGGHHQGQGRRML